MNAVEVIAIFLGVIALTLLEVFIGTWLWGVIAVGIFSLPALTPL